MEFFRLTTVIRHNIDRYKTKFGKPYLTIDTFFMRKNLKSKHYRKFFAKSGSDIKRVKTTLNRYTWADINEVDSIREIRFHKVWTYNFLPIELRDFSFKLLNNYHKLNGGIAHFNENISAACTPCSLKNLRPSPKETLKHFFYECPVNNNFAHTYFNTFLNRINIDFSMDFLLLGAPSILPESLAFIINIEIIMMNFFLFNSRYKNRLPLLRNIQHYTSWHRTLFCKNKNYDEKYQRFRFDPG